MDSEDCTTEVLPEVFTENSNDKEDQDMPQNSNIFANVSVVIISLFLGY